MPTYMFEEMYAHGVPWTGLAKHNVATENYSKTKTFVGENINSKKNTMKVAHRSIVVPHNEVVKISKTKSAEAAGGMRKTKKSKRRFSRK